MSFEEGKSFSELRRREKVFCWFYLVMLVLVVIGLVALAVLFWWNPMIDYRP